jgi:oligoribonuclease
VDGHGNDRLETTISSAKNAFPNSFAISLILILVGLDVDVNRVIQVAMLVSDANLNVISTDFNTVIHQSDEVIDNMNDWCKLNMQDLAAESKASGISEQNAEDMMLAFIKQYVDQPRLSPLAGNTIYMDRMFLRKYFPRVDEYLHYRIIDVSTVKELCGRWNKKVYNSAPKKELKHRALEDIRESINELKHYKEKFFIVNN